MKKQKEIDGFKIYNVVEWESQSGGIQYEKAGEIIFIVPSGYLIKEKDCMGLKRRFDLPVKPRKYKSYIIKVGEYAYWPVVSKLRKVGWN